MEVLSTVKIIIAKKYEPDEEAFNKWKKLVNMSVKELKNFIDSEEGQKAGLSKSKAKQLGIHSGKESASWIMKMKPLASSFKNAEKNWTPKMWYWCARQNSFISRMLGNKGSLFEKDKKTKTRKHLSLLIWGHDPLK